MPGTAAAPEQPVFAPAEENKVKQTKEAIGRALTEFNAGRPASALKRAKEADAIADSISENPPALAAFRAAAKDVTRKMIIAYAVKAKDHQTAITELKKLISDGRHTQTDIAWLEMLEAGRDPTEL